MVLLVVVVRPGQYGAAFAHLVPMSGGVLGQVPDVAGHVAGDEPPDGVAGVHGDPHRPVRRQDEAGRLQVARIVVDVRARRRGDLADIDAVPDGEAQLVLGDERGGGLLVVDGQRDDLDAEFGQRVERAGERGELRVAVRAPGPAVDQDDAVGAGEVVRQRDRAAADSGTSSGGNG